MSIWRTFGITLSRHLCSTGQLRHLSPPILLSMKRKRTTRPSLSLPIWNTRVAVSRRLERSLRYEDWVQVSGLTDGTFSSRANTQFVSKKVTMTDWFTVPTRLRLMRKSPVRTCCGSSCCQLASAEMFLPISKSTTSMGSLSLAPRRA